MTVLKSVLYGLRVVWAWVQLIAAVCMFVVAVPVMVVYCLALFALGTGAALVVFLLLVKLVRFALTEL